MLGVCNLPNMVHGTENLEMFSKGGVKRNLRERERECRRDGKEWRAVGSPQRFQHCATSARTLQLSLHHELCNDARRTRTTCLYRIQ